MKSFKNLELFPEDDFLRKLNQLIIEHINNADYTLDHLSQDLLLSRSQLHRKIKDDIGISTSLYVRQIKLLKAKEFLRDEAINISEVAYATGFKSPQTLSRYFSSTFGVTPSQFRQNIHKYPEREVSESEASTELGRQKDKPDIKIQGADLKLPLIDISDPEGKDNEGIGAKNKIHSVKIEPAKEPTFQNLSNELDLGKRTYFKKTLIYAFIAIAILCLVAMIAYENDLLGNNKADEGHVATSENSIAVLPFLSIGSDETSTFSAGMQEDILTKLAFFKDLKVISRTSTEIFNGSNKTIKEIGSELGVSYILEGSVRIEGHQVAVTTQLIRTEDDFHVWADNYVRDVADVFKIQNEISLDVAKILNQKITDQTKSQINNSYTPGKEAYRDFLIGKELLKERTHSSLMASIKQFDQALSIEPEFVDAVVMKSSAYQLLGNIGYDRRDEHIVNSEKFALTALRMDAQNAKAYAILACIYRDAHKWDQAKVTFETALEYAPNDALINYWYSLMLREIGDLENAVLYSDKAKQLDPLYPVIHAGHIVNLAYNDDREDAGEAIAAGDILFNQSFMHHWAKAVYFESIFDHQSAMEAFDKVLQINPELNTAHHGRLFNKARLGHEKEIIEFIAGIKTDTGDDLATKALLYAGLKDADQTATYMIRAMQKGVFPSDILVDKNYDFLRGHAKYEKILDEYNLINYDKQKNVEVL